MGLFENREDERFEFTLEITPRSAGDFGAVSIGGCYRSPSDCISNFTEIKEQIERHVDGVDSVSLIISDVYNEYADFSEWEYESIVNKLAKEKEISKWKVKSEDVLKQLPKRSPDTDELKSHIAWMVKFLSENKGNLTSEMIDDIIDDSQEYL